jgi:hypothetical protein
MYVLSNASATPRELNSHLCYQVKYVNDGYLVLTFFAFDTHVYCARKKNEPALGVRTWCHFPFFCSEVRRVILPLPLRREKEDWPRQRSW